MVTKMHKYEILKRGEFTTQKANVIKVNDEGAVKGVSQNSMLTERLKRELYQRFPLKKIENGRSQVRGGKHGSNWYLRCCEWRESKEHL